MFRRPNEEEKGITRGENRLIADSIQTYIDGVNRWRAEVMSKAKAHFEANSSLFPDSFSSMSLSESPSREIYIGKGDKPEHWVRRGESTDHTELFEGIDRTVLAEARRNHPGEIEYYLTVDVTADINAHGDKIPKRRNAMAYAQGLGVGVNRTADELITTEGLLSGQQRPLVLDSRE